jgi:hypothetical protein
MGRAHVEKIGADIWIGGAVTSCITGTCEDPVSLGAFAAAAVDEPGIREGSELTIPSPDRKLRRAD